MCVQKGCLQGKQGALHFRSMHAICMPYGMWGKAPWQVKSHRLPRVLAYHRAPGKSAGALACHGRTWQGIWQEAYGMTPCAGSMLRVHLALDRTSTVSGHIGKTRRTRDLLVTKYGIMP